MSELETAANGSTEKGFFGKLAMGILVSPKRIGYMGCWLALSSISSLM